MSEDSQADRSFRYTPALLGTYSRAALANGQELLEEAEILLDREHFARAYFLAVSAIEETGKASIAFDAMGRNLQDSAVTAKVRRSLESHSSKINAAFHAVLLSSSDLRNEVMDHVNLMIALSHGREPSMYTDIKYPDPVVTIPKQMVREVAARDCIRLAKHCHAKTAQRLASEAPRNASRWDDELYSMKGSKFKDLVNTEDFWWFHIARMESGTPNLAESVSIYQREYLQKGKLFRKSP